MDDTQSNRTSEAAAATRKRRSSILKSQRPPRTPFSELEFNVATPTDTAKSRRVSFSRRTGVAEFVTNEATTTWKNLYEEHNKSLESSGNESGANVPRSIGHIGTRIFDKQFQEEEAVDFGATIDTHSAHISDSINNVNFSQHASFSTDDRKLPAPNQNFEMSEFTDHQSKLFGDDLAMPTMGEMSGRIDVNFSAVQTIGNAKDDLDEIQNDLKRARSIGVCPLMGRRSLSEYIEMDLDATHVTIKQDDDDMSITDTIHSPKVQHVSQNLSSALDKKASISNDWVADKENIALNPYITPKESINFAVNENSDKILVFDGKRLTIQSDKEADKILKECTSETVPKEAKTHQRKTIVLNVNDDLPNFKSTQGMMRNESSLAHERSRTLVYDDLGDISVTQAVPANIMLNDDKVEHDRRRTMVYNDNEGNISITQAVPAKIVFNEQKAEGQRRRTMLYDDIEGNISITQAVPAKIVFNEHTKLEERRRTVVYDDVAGNISITQGIPANIMINEKTSEKRRTIYDDIAGNISITQAVPANIILNEQRIKDDKSRTMVYADIAGDISFTQAIPQNIMFSENVKTYDEKEKTTVYDDLSGNISITQAIPSRIVCNEQSKVEDQRRKSIVYDELAGNISFTQAIPPNIMVNKIKEEKRRTMVYDDIAGNISMTQALPANIIFNEKCKIEDEKSRTINDDVLSHISFTQALPPNIIPNNEGKIQNEKNPSIFDDVASNISFTQAIAPNIIANDGGQIQNEKRRTIVFDDKADDISFTQVIPPNIMANDGAKKPDEKRRTIVFDDVASNISFTQAVPPNIIPNNEGKIQNEKRRTIVFDDMAGNISFTQVIPPNIMANDGAKKPDEKRRTIVFDDVASNISFTQAVPPNIIPNNEGTTQNEKRRTIVFDDDNISFTQVIPPNIMANKSINHEKNESMVHSDNANISIAHTVPPKQNLDNIAADKFNMSVTQSVLVNVLIVNNAEKRKSMNANTEACKSKDNREDDDEHNSVPVPDQRQETIPESSTANTASNNTVGNKSINRTQLADVLTSDKPVLDQINSKDGFINIIRDCEDEMQASNEHKSNKTLTHSDNVDNFIDALRNVSIVQDMPSNVMLSEKNKVQDDKRKSVYDVAAKVISKDFVENKANMSVINTLGNVLIVNNAMEKRKSITYDANNENLVSDDNQGNTEEESTDNESKNISDVQFIPEQRQEVLPERSKSVFSNDPKEERAVTRTQPADIISEAVEEDNNTTSSDGLIYIIRDCESETQTSKTDDQKPNKSITWNDEVPKIQHSPLSLEYKEDIDAQVSADLPKKLDELKSLVGVKNPPANRIYEKVVSSDVDDKLLDKSESQDKFEMSKGGKSFKDANDTNELLEMLSDLTDKSNRQSPEKPVEKEVNEPRRLSVAPNRLSIVISREDLLNKISMAQAALQRSIEIDESIDTSDTPEEVSLPKKAVRVSNEVVKKLQFEDESASETSIKSDIKGSPLKKTAFGETSYMKENKSKVIPSYLKDVSDEIKALMHDLVKPNVDSVAFQAPTPESLKREPSTCSTQIQANLITSSQIDLDTELTSVTESGYELAKASAFSMDSRSYKSPAKLSDVEMPQEISFRPKRATPSPPVQDRVIVFDHYNPLNNILLAPIDYSHVHRYNPHKSNDTICADSQSVHSPKEVDSLEKKNTQFVGNVTVTHSMQPSGDSVPDKSDAQSLLSNASKPASVDESVSVRVCELKDTKVNTLIAMKGNKELLEASSSLTLVDDALAHNAFDVDLDMVTAESSSTNNAQGNSPVKVIYHNDEPDVVLSEKVDSDLTSNDEMVEPVKMSTKAKKRNYSPTKKEKHKFSALSSLDVTPKPITKMQKMSNSPKYASRKDVSPEKLTAEKDENVRSKSAMDVDDSSDSKNASPKEHKRSPRKSKSPKSKKPGTSVTVQQLLTKYDIHPEIDQEALNKQIIQALSRSDSSTAPNTVSLTDVQSKSPDIVSSFTSSKNHNEMREASSVTTTESHTLSSSKSRSAKLEWQPESVNEKNSNVMSECDSSVNVVAKIDMLPFMGSHECEWEASGIDTWSFRLLHARLRLTARLAHRHDNATRTRVRADTPVRALSLDTAHQDKNNTVATLCVGFACEAMRYFTSRGCRTAGDVPALLKRCAGVARVALRWGRAMHEARLHLAYTLDGDRLALKGLVLQKDPHYNDNTSLLHEPLY
ncbi:uncharacterized protein LOC135085866 [Ostrinia nubilalis]|uniref:uncharacterized protein LOC135085866 n=1 Tax=Ostrinia nubilalis TaxID=29057 RepID=UPI0030824388